nr:MAG TPA: hypothetical protein [Caudoviricetes sp.]DAS12187.1 MAG TPA: hypothetical protein [Caudoviricetes sp.]
MFIFKICFSRLHYILYYILSCYLIFRSKIIIKIFDKIFNILLYKNILNIFFILYLF